MDFEFHIQPKFRKNKKETIMTEAEPVNINEKISETKNGLTKMLADHPEALVLGVGLLCYVSYQHGRNRALMDTMRLAALDRE